MRAFRLAVVTLEAERVRLGLQARRLAIRAAFGAAAALLFLYALGTAHVVGWFALEGVLTPLPRAAVLLAVDVVLAGILLMLALRNSPSSAELEARILRDTALAQTRASLAVMPLLAGAARSYGAGMLFDLWRRRRARKDAERFAERELRRRRR
jgi:hypothetical protein